MNPTLVILSATAIVCLWTLVGAWSVARMWDGWQKAEAERERAARFREERMRELIGAVIVLSKDDNAAYLGGLLASKTDTSGAPATFEPIPNNRQHRVPVS